MLAIILSACLAGDPQVCKDYKISVDADLDVSTCVMNAPPYFAQWADEHPGWKIQRWHCTNKNEDNI